MQVISIKSDLYLFELLMLSFLLDIHSVSELKVVTLKLYNFLYIIIFINLYLIAHKSAGAELVGRFPLMQRASGFNPGSYDLSR